MSKRHPAFPLNRRQVLRAGLYGLGASAMPSLFARAMAADGTEAHPERILVVVELDGGNDGLNTVVPYGDDAYYRQRPSIGIPAKDVLRIDDYFGFHPSMAASSGFTTRASWPSCMAAATKTRSCPISRPWGSGIPACPMAAKHSAGWDASPTPCGPTAPRT